MNFRTLSGGTLCLLLVACGGGDQEANAGEPAEEMEAAVDEGAAIAEMTEYFETHYNMGHANMVADLYGEEAAMLAANGMVLEGRAAIEEYFQTNMDAISAQVSIDAVEQLVMGDMAVSRGNYSIDGEAEGEAVSFGGAYLNFLAKEGEDWKVQGAVTNYDTDAGDRWVGMPEGGEDPPEESMLTALAEAYETHYNLGHASMVADLYTQDAQVAFPGGGWISGYDAITQAIQTGMDNNGGAQLDIHGVETVDMGDGMVMDAGWYENLVDGETVGWGTYALVGQQNADGEWQIKWLVGNASPAPQG